jgi:serine/threonine protein kinase
MPAVPSSVQPGRAFGKYVIKRLVAEGGMAVVFEAQHSKLGQRVAIKLLNANLAQKPDIVARFHREAQAAARIPSQHVVRVIDVEATEDGRPYIVMEYLEGRDLEDEIRARGPLPVGDAVAFLLEAASAVSIAHRAGIIHRDIKPANIFVADEKPRKVVKVLDFGISKVDSPTEISSTSTQTMLGTPLYMSPEQVRSARDVDGRTDIWSLGVVLYEMLTGQLPFYAEEASAVIAAIVSDPVVPVRQIRPDIPQALEDIVMKALQKDRNQRFRLVDDLSNALLPFAPPWFRQPVPSSDRVPSPALPAHLSASLADSLEDEHTVADPDAAPDALKPAPQIPDTQPAFVPLQQQPQYLASEPSQPNAVTRTTAGGDKKRQSSNTLFVLAVALVITLVAGAVAVKLLLDRSAQAQPAPPPAETVTYGRILVDGACALRIDGVERHDMPSTGFDVTPGDHTVRCTTVNGERKEKTVHVSVGQTETVQFGH